MDSIETYAADIQAVGTNALPIIKKYITKKNKEQDDSSVLSEEGYHGLRYFNGKLQADDNGNWVDIVAVSGGGTDESAFKSAMFENNVLKFYSGDGKLRAELNLPEERFLDQAKTQFVENFVWSDTEYPNSTDPNLDNKPVLILAVKGDTSVSYSFVPLNKIVKTYTGGKTNSASTTVENGEIETNVKVSSESGNSIEIKEDGIFASLTGTVPVSQEPGNLVEQKDDGFYVGSVTSSDILQLSARVAALENIVSGIAPSNTFVHTFENAIGLKVFGGELDEENARLKF